MALDKLNALQTVPLFRCETPEMVTQNGVVAVDKHTITVDETLILNRFEGQTALIVFDATAGGEDGNYLHVVSNTDGAGVSTVTFEEDVSAILADNDEIAITTCGQPKLDAGAQTTKYFGVFRSNTLPLIVRTLFQGYYHGSANLPGLEELIPVLNEYGDTLEVWLKNAELLALAMGECEETTADFDALDPAQALAANDHYPGAKHITMAAAADARFTDGKIIYIVSTTGKGEVAKISGAPAGAVITLTDPLKNFHDGGDLVHEIAQAVVGVPDTVITKTIKLAKNLPTFTLEFTGRRTERWLSNDVVVQIMGLIMESMDFNSSPGDEPLKMSFGVKGLHSRHKTTAGADLVAGGSKVEEGFDQGSYLPTASYVSVNAIKYREAEAITVSINRNIDTAPVHNEGTRPYYLPGDPYEHWPGVVETKFNVMIPLRNKNLYNHVIAGTEVDCVILYTRAGLNDQLKVTAKDVVFNTTGLEIPEEGKYPQNMDGQALFIEIEVKDFVPYYVL